MEVADYQYYQLPGTRKWFRGPPLTDPNARPVTFLGAASCFGRFVPTPYADLIAKDLGVTVRNLGYGGARAGFYSGDPVLLSTINQSSCVVLELFSARGTATSKTEPASEHSARLRWIGSDEEFVFSDRFFTAARNTLSAADFANLIKEIRNGYVRETTELLRKIRVPKIVFWLSQREPDTDATLGEPRSFPHFVDGECVSRIGAAADAFVSVVSRRGIPSKLRSRTTGEPVEIFPWKELEQRSANDYYPSPEMHVDAAEALAPVIRSLIDREQSSAAAPPPLPKALARAKLAQGQPGPGGPGQRKPGQGLAKGHPGQAGESPAPGNPRKGLQFLMIAGCPRSGTSALHRLLNLHPRIALGLERFNTQITNEKLKPEMFAPDRFFEVRPADTWYKDFSRFEGVYERLQRKYNRALYVGDKYPRAYAKYDFLAKTLPGCRFVYIVREIVDVAKSYEARRAKEKNWPATRDARMAVTEWNEGNHETLRAIGRHPVLVVSYEALFKRGDSLATLGSFLGLDLGRLENIRNAAADKRASEKSASEKTGGDGEPRPALSPDDLDYIGQNADMAAYRELLATAGSAAQAGGGQETLAKAS